MNCSSETLCVDYSLEFQSLETTPKHLTKPGTTCVESKR